METQEQESPTSKKKPYRARLLTIMVMGGLGNVRSFQVSRHILLWASLFFLAFVVFSIVAINRYLELREVNSQLLDNTGRLEEELAMNRKALQRSRQHVSLLEEYIVNKEERPDTLSKAAKETLSQTKRGELAGKPALSKEATEEVIAKPLAELIQIQDMAIEMERTRLRVSFRLVNSQPSNHPVGGYIHVIAEDNNSDPPRWWAYPQQKLTNGVPENFRNGQHFSLSRNKLIQGRIQLGSGSPSPAAIKVLIYDQSGTLAIERLFEVMQGS